MPPNAVLAVRLTIPLDGGQYSDRDFRLWRLDGGAAAVPFEVVRLPFASKGAHVRIVVDGGLDPGEAYRLEYNNPLFVDELGTFHVVGLADLTAPEPIAAVDASVAFSDVPVDQNPYCPGTTPARAARIDVAFGAGGRPAST